MRQAAIFIWLSFWFSVLVASVPKEQLNEIVHCPQPVGSRFPAPILKSALGVHSGLYEAYLNMWLAQKLSPQSKSLYGESCMQSMIASVVRFEPHHESIYILASYILTFSLKKPEEAFEALLVGHKLFPESWRLLMILGYIKAFELEDKKSAAVFYKLAALIRPEITYVGSLADKLIKNQEINPDSQEKLRRHFLSPLESEKVKQFMEQQ